MPDVQFSELNTRSCYNGTYHSEAVRNARRVLFLEITSDCGIIVDEAKDNQRCRFNRLRGVPVGVRKKATEYANTRQPNKLNRLASSR